MDFEDIIFKILRGSLHGNVFKEGKAVVKTAHILVRYYTSPVSFIKMHVVDLSQCLPV